MAHQWCPTCLDLLDPGQQECQPCTIAALLARVAELEALLKPIVDECDEMGPESCTNPVHAAARKALNR
jgi:hypothetical protein